MSYGCERSCSSHRRVSIFFELRVFRRQGLRADADAADADADAEAMLKP